MWVMLLGRMTGYCALCSMELHTRRCFKDPKSFVNGAAILPGYFTSNLKGNVIESSIGNILSNIFLKLPPTYNI